MGLWSSGYDVAFTPKSTTDLKKIYDINYELIANLKTRIMF